MSFKKKSVLIISFLLVVLTANVVMAKTYIVGTSADSRPLVCRRR